MPYLFEYVICWLYALYILKKIGHITNILHTQKDRAYNQHITAIYILKKIGHITNILHTQKDMAYNQHNLFEYVICRLYNLSF